MVAYSTLEVYDMQVVKPNLHNFNGIGASRLTFFIVSTSTLFKLKFSSQFPPHVIGACLYMFPHDKNNESIAIIAFEFSQLVITCIVLIFLPSVPVYF